MLQFWHICCCIKMPRLVVDIVVVGLITLMIASSKGAGDIDLYCGLLDMVAIVFSFYYKV